MTGPRYGDIGWIPRPLDEVLLNIQSRLRLAERAYSPSAELVDIYRRSEADVVVKMGLASPIK